VTAPQLDYRFPSSVPVSQPLKELLCRVFVKTREARIGLAELAAHPWVVNGGALPPIATMPTPAGRDSGLRPMSCNKAGGAHHSIDSSPASLVVSVLQAFAAPDDVMQRLMAPG
jgi:hypothetical protein